MRYQLRFCWPYTLLGEAILSRIGVFDEFIAETGGVFWDNKLELARYH